MVLLDGRDHAIRWSAAPLKVHNHHTPHCCSRLDRASLAVSTSHLIADHDGSGIIQSPSRTGKDSSLPTPPYDAFPMHSLRVPVPTPQPYSSRAAEVYRVPFPWVAARAYACRVAHVRPSGRWCGVCGIGRSVFAPGRGSPSRGLCVVPSAHVLEERRCDCTAPREL